MERKQRKHILTGSLILIALGVLIILDKSGVYEFSKSWPILLIVISTGTLVQRIQDVGGWFIGIVGVIFFVMHNFYPEIENWAQYILPALLILLGAYILVKHFQKSGKKIE